MNPNTLYMYLFLMVLLYIEYIYLLPEPKALQEYLDCVCTGMKYEVDRGFKDIYTTIHLSKYVRQNLYTF